MSPSSPAGSSSSSLPYSNVLLALPDGPIPPGPDRSSSTISLIGGYPSFPLEVPPSACGVCHAPIPLLAQVYAPPEEGENDRTLYVFACPKAKCQRREGAVRAFRASKKNEEYVRDVAAKRAAREEEECKAKEQAKINPFSIGATPNGALFGNAQPLFGAAPAASTPTAPVNGVTEDLTALSIGSSTTTLAPPHPAYMPPLYLSTIEEYLPPPGDVDMDDDDEDETEEQKAEWRDERFESLLPKGMDMVFERFVRRLDGAEGGAKQVLRYELDGVPLPYSFTSPLTKKLFPTLPHTKPDDEEPSYPEHYAPSGIPPCGRCGGKRVFEMQLVPSIISLLRPELLSITGEEPSSKTDGKVSEAERKKELERLAKGQGAGGEGMEWGTIMVFGCLRDCVGFGEEWVGVEWEAILGGNA